MHGTAVFFWLSVVSIGLIHRCVAFNHARGREALQFIWVVDDSSQWEIIFSGGSMSWNWEKFWHIFGSVIIWLYKKSATDRRLVRYIARQKLPLSLPDWGGYFCGLWLSLPNVYPILKQVKPKPTTAIKSTILIGLALLSSEFPYGFLCNQRVTVPLLKD